MTTYEMLQKAINAKIKKGTLTETYVESTKNKMDVFLMNERITDEEYNDLIELLEG